MKLLYIAAPYKAKTICSLQQNIHEAKLMSMYYWNKGYAVICPHKNTENFDGLMPDKVFLQGTMLMLSKCDAIAMHPNWEQSSGSVDEHDFMIQRKREEEIGYIDTRFGKPLTQIFYPDWDDVLTILDKLYKEG